MTADTPAHPPRIKVRAFWARVGAILGGGISIAANVAHSFVPPADAIPDWQPKIGAVLGSTFWPVILFVAVEILVSSRWPKGFWFATFRFGGLIPVVIVAGIVSYRHMRGLLLHYGEDHFIAMLGPLAIDGLMVMATAALMAARKLAYEEHETTTVTATTAAGSGEPVASAAQPTPARRPGMTDAEMLRGRIQTMPHLINMARAQYEAAQREGRTLHASELATRINVGIAVAEQLLADIHTEQHTPNGQALDGPVLNGQLVAGGVS